MLNFTGFIRGNFSDGLINCFQFSNDTYYYAVIRFAQYDSNLATFLWSFFFGMLGNTLTIKNVFDTIIADIDS